MNNEFFFIRYHASIYPCPNTATERLETATKVDTSIEDLQMVTKGSFFNFIFLF